MDSPRKTGRPAKLPEKKRRKVTLTLPPELLEALFEKTRSQGISMSQFVEKAIIGQNEKEESTAPRETNPTIPPMLSLP